MNPEVLANEFETTESLTMSNDSIKQEKSIDLSGDNGVIKQLIKEGLLEMDDSNTSNIPKSGQTVEVHYTGTLQDGTVFDSSRDRNTPFKFDLNSGSVIRGWDIAVASMEKGEISNFTIRSDYAYGDAGSPPTIPPKATLNFNIELLDITDKKKNKYTMTPEEKIEQASNEHRQGNEQFTQGNIQEAIDHYTLELSYIEIADQFTGELKEQYKKLTINANLNLANCFLKTKDYVQVNHHTTQALTLAPDNGKGLYRRGVARIHLGEFSDAKQDLIKASKNNFPLSEIKKQLLYLNQQWDIQKQKEKQTYGGFFSKLTLYNEKSGPRLPRDLTKCPKVFLNIEIREPENPITFQLIIALYNDTVPKTVENFIQLCLGTQGQCISDSTKKLHYKNSTFHRLIKGFMLQGGDFTKGDGTGGESIYGERFDDENFVDQHNHRGILSMANAGPNTNGSQFFIIFGSTPHLNGKHVVFGEVISGLEHLDQLETMPTDENDRPNVPIIISDCGEYTC